MIPAEVIGGVFLVVPVNQTKEEKEMYFDKLAAYDEALTEAVLEKIAEEQGMSPEEAAAALAAAAQQGEEEEKQVEAMLEMA